MDYAVIMAGGAGKRLWPLSRQKRPKHLIQIYQGKTLLRCCFDRLTPLFDIKNIFVQTNADYAELVRENLPELPADNVISEPAVRDTAGAIGLAASILYDYEPDSTMALVTADHIIEPQKKFRQTIRDGLNFINNNPDSLLIFGIEPSYPSTQLGYIKFSKGQTFSCCENQIHTVEEFREKPDYKTAVKYIDSGNYLWNSGMFVWKSRTILQNLEKFLPASTLPLREIARAWKSSRRQEVLDKWYIKLPKISIDYAVMEKATNIYATKLHCRWLDLGSFTALAEIIETDENNNIRITKSSELLDCKNSVIVTEDEQHLIAAIGLDNIIIAHSPDATLVCTSDQAPRLKELLDKIKKHKGDKYL